MRSVVVCVWDRAASDAIQRQMMAPINQRLSYVKSVIERGEAASFAQVCGWLLNERVTTLGDVHWTLLFGCDPGKANAQ